MLRRKGSEEMLLTERVSAIALITVLVLPLSGLSQGAQNSGARESKAESGVIVCRVMETFEDNRLGMRAIIFHQRDKADGPRLGALLVAQSGKEMDLETIDGRRYHVTVFRVKSAFGRGLVMVPTSRLKLIEHDEFNLLLPPAD